MVDYYACIKYKYQGIPDTAFTLTELNDSIVITYWDSNYGTQPTMLELSNVYTQVLRAKALVDIKDIRRQGLDKAAISPGILAIYNSNYEAAVEYLENRPTTVLKNGMTVENYLLGFCAKLNMTVVQFVNYIIAENKRVGPTAYEVEKRYLALAYGGDIQNGIYPVSMLNDEAAITAAVLDYYNYCQL